MNSSNTELLKRLNIPEELNGFTFEVKPSNSYPSPMEFRVIASISLPSYYRITHIDSSNSKLSEEAFRKYKLQRYDSIEEIKRVLTIEIQDIQESISEKLLEIVNQYDREAQRFSNKGLELITSKNYKGLEINYGELDNEQ